MNMLASLKNTDGTKIAEEKDSVGGGKTVFDSNVYGFTIGMAYTAKSEGGALGLFLTLLTEDNRELRITQWMTSGNAKGCKTYYTKDGENYPLPGFSMANSLALLTTGKEIGDLEPEEKVIKLYSKDAKAEVPTKVQAVTELIGKQVIAGVLRVTVDVTKKAEGATEYTATGEKRDENEIDKFFCAREEYLNMTTTEIKAQATEAVFIETWKNKNVGQTRDKSKGAGAVGTAGAPGAAAGAAAGTPKPKQSLFGAKPTA